MHGPGVDEPLVWYEGATTSNKTWLYSDHQGSVVATANAAGTSTATLSYGPYGEPNQTTGIRFRYTGQQLLGPLNLYYYKARFYSPAIGRFLQTDPIGYRDGLNLYAYVGNNPFNRRDPSGLITFTMNGELQLANWISEIGQKVGIFNAPVSSVQIGVAESFPFFDGAERDSGIFVSGGAGDGVSSPFHPGNIKGIGSISLTAGISPGSVKDLAGKDNVYSATTSFPAPLSGSYSQNASTGSFSGISLGIGAGLSVGVNQTITGVLSLNHGFIGYSDTPRPTTNNINGLAGVSFGSNSYVSTPRK